MAVARASQSPAMDFAAVRWTSDCTRLDWVAGRSRRAFICTSDFWMMKSGGTTPSATSWRTASLSWSMAVAKSFRRDR